MRFRPVQVNARAAARGCDSGCPVGRRIVTGATSFSAFSHAPRGPCVSGPLISRNSARPVSQVAEAG